MIDSFTQWPEAIAVPNMEAVTTARALFTHWISRHGTPLSILTDRGGAFEGKVFQELCTILNVRKLRTSAYHPQGNGKAENFVGSLKTILTSILATSSSIDWEDAIPYALMAYRTTVHKSTTYTPAYLTYGRELSYPLECIIGIPQPEVNYPPSNYAQEAYKNLTEAYEKVRQKLQEAQRRQKRYYDERTHDLPVNVDDLIYLKNQVPKPLEPKWLGPFKVLKVISDKVLEIVPTDNSTGARGG